MERMRLRRIVNARHTAPAIVLTLLLALAPVARASETTLTIDAGAALGAVSPRLYGLMTEEINYAYDGGLYAELVRNRVLLDDHDEPVHWQAWPAGGAAASIALDPAQPLNDAVPTSLRVDVARASDDAPAGVLNEGYFGIAVRPSTRYRASFWAKAAPGFSGRLTVALGDATGEIVLARARSQTIDGTWTRYELTLTTDASVTATRDARLFLTVDRPGTIWLGAVSLFPPTWKSRANGLRPDIMKLLVDLKPAFLRFPGGNHLEGITVATRFDWKKTIGPIETRPGHPGAWGYRSSDGMGLLEFLQWAEDLGAEPLIGLYAGFSLNREYVAPGPALEPFVLDALDEIEYAIGPVTSPWGARRAADGHPAPFELRYVEIGNEDFFDTSGSYDARFAQFHDAIRARYPHLKIISSSGTVLPVESRTPDVLDDHFYLPLDRMLSEADDILSAYEPDGPEILIGEWAAFPATGTTPPADNPTPDMARATGDATWMAAMERRSNVITMQCYAPLLANVDGFQWKPDLIAYDGLRAYGSPSYHAFAMFSRNIGDEILATRMTGATLGHSVTRDARRGRIFVKLVNPDPSPRVVTVRIDGAEGLSRTALSSTLSAAPDVANTIDDPRRIVPVTRSISGVASSFEVMLEGTSVKVLELRVRPRGGPPARPLPVRGAP